MAASAGYPFPEAEWIAPTANKQAAQEFVQNYLSWTLQRPFDDRKVVQFAKRFTHDAAFLYTADEHQFRKIFGDELGSRFHYNMNYRSPYGHSANMKKHLTSFTSSASGYYAALAHLIDESSNASVIKKRGSGGSRAGDEDDAELPPMPSPPASVYLIGKVRRRTADYVLKELETVGNSKKSFFFK